MLFAKTHPLDPIYTDQITRLLDSLSILILQMKVIMAVLLNNYDFELGDDPVETDYGRVVLGPKPPIHIRYRKRNV